VGRFRLVVATRAARAVAVVALRAPLAAATTALAAVVMVLAAVAPVVAALVATVLARLRCPRPGMMMRSCPTSRIP
jgi:hypothetical protein